MTQHVIKIYQDNLKMLLCLQATRLEEEWGSGCKLHVFLISATDTGVKSASRSDRFATEERVPLRPISTEWETEWTQSRYRQCEEKMLCTIGEIRNQILWSSSS